MSESPANPRCPLCQRLTPAAQLTKHHTTPKSRGGRRTEMLCATCHGQVHATFSTRELETAYDSVEKLRKAPELQAYLQWIAKQKPTRQFRRRRRRSRR